MPKPKWFQSFMSTDWVALLPAGLLFMAQELSRAVGLGAVSMDSHAYWAALQDPAGWYTKAPGAVDAFLYSPAFAQALWPLTHVPWPAFRLLWSAAQLGALAWLLSPLPWRRALVVIPFISTELILGNVYLFYAVVLVLALRRAPGALALPLLTKVFPFIPALWFVVRREWSSLLRLSIVVVAVVAVSVVLDPGAWSSWVTFLRSSASTGAGVGADIRLVFAVALVVWAARRNVAPLLAVAMVLACPVFGGYSPLAILTAVPRLMLWQRHPKQLPEVRFLTWRPLAVQRFSGRAPVRVAARTAPSAMRAEGDSEMVAL